ncbi:hypothetical protein LPJ81_004416, partial [Coemansia sp. IMI 209127]
MSTLRTGNSRAYAYKHLSDEQALRLDDIRHTAKVMDKAYTGYFLMTRSEYFMLLPMLNPIVIAWNTRAYKQMCRSVDVSKETKRKMMQNLLLSSLIGFLPIANIAFNRKFKCTTRNLQAVEAQMQDDEYDYEEQMRAKEAVNTELMDQIGKLNIAKLKKNGMKAKKARRIAREMYESVPLPLSTKRMFNKCPRFIRNTDYPHIAYTPVVPGQSSSNRNSTATAYHSPRTSLDLEGFEGLESLWSSMQNDGPSFRDSSISRSSIGSDTTLAEDYPGAKKRAGLFAKNMAAILALSSSKKLGNEGVQPPMSFAKVMKEL